MPATSYAKMECWGASGGNGLSDGAIRGESGGKGGYTKGILTLSSAVTLYIYVGGKGEDGLYKSNASGSWNGGGSGCHDGSDDESGGGGGGASDIRLINNSWDNFNSLKSRIMVAGAGGGGSFIGSDKKGNIGGPGGGIEGGRPKKWNSETNTYVEFSGTVSTQTGGYAFGKGQNASQPGQNTDFGGGGSGYYGGYISNILNIGWNGSPGYGGSSFISGHTGCNAIKESSTSSNIVHTGQPNHYSGYVFTNTVMKAGNESMPSPTGGTETGHNGNGYCKITWHPAL